MNDKMSNDLMFRKENQIIKEPSTNYCHMVVCRVNNALEPTHEMLFVFETVENAQKCVDTLYTWKFTPKEILRECVESRGTDDNEAMMFLANQLISDALTIYEDDLVIGSDNDLVAEEVATILLFESSNYDLDFYVKEMSYW